MPTDIARKLFTVSDYHKMADAGILHESDHVELIRGEIVEMAAISPKHNGTIHQANRFLVRMVGDDAIVGVQGSIRLDNFSEPQPDLYLLKPKEDFYKSRHAGPADVILIIEVADSSLDYDRTTKMKLYAESGIPEYWISDLQSESVIIFADPEKDGYRSVRYLRRGQSAAPALLNSCVIPAEVILP